ncbi:DUF6879 family protein [Streptomyces xinghaiensis]|uniref:DUF6879 family protein n=1 Tax=Streptomyces xinghaiensis TaxID=1038928 RepID=UPI0005952C60|nr:DUF6879 family protein [Streptomyces xinghaiensis]MZE78557.1 hypothetical protein [Streptomyces sp. SID5475]
MHEIFDGAHGTRLEQASYTPDFMERFWRIGAEGFWKLERMQHYDEGDFPSYVAFRSGDWGRSLQLIEELRPAYEEEFGKITGSDIGLHRVRVVERPVTPYIQWELNVLHVKQEYGEQVSVLEAERVASYEREEPLPELCVLGSEAVYVLDYTPAGAPDGATRFTQSDVVARSRAFLRELYAMGDGVEAYFPREIAHLEAPDPGL